MTERISGSPFQTKELRRMMSTHRANERGYRNQEEALQEQHPGQWIAVYNRGRDNIIAEARDELFDRMREGGLTSGSEFVAFIPRPLNSNT